MAITAYGATAYLDDASGTPTLMGEVINIKPFDISVDMAETTHMTSTSGFRTHMPTLSSVGTSEIQINFDPGSATDVLVRTATTDRLVRTLKITYSDTTYQQAECFVTGWEIGGFAPDGKLEATMTVQATGVAAWG